MVSYLKNHKCGQCSSESFIFLTGRVHYIWPLKYHWSCSKCKAFRWQSDFGCFSLVGFGDFMGPPGPGFVSSIVEVFVGGGFWGIRRCCAWC
jgi:hypothetical protein